MSNVRMMTGQKVRKANKHFWEESGIRNNRTQKQHPYLALRPSQTRVNIDLVYNAEELLELPTNTRVLAQWKGKKRSDFYSFKVGDLKAYINENPPSNTQRF
jgi:hypothetical protein